VVRLDGVIDHLVRVGEIVRIFARVRLVMLV
jgi:hypothetical protein